MVLMTSESAYKQTTGHKRTHNFAQGGSYEVGCIIYEIEPWWDADKLTKLTANTWEYNL